MWLLSICVCVACGVLHAGLPGSDSFGTSAVWCIVKLRVMLQVPATRVTQPTPCLPCKRKATPRSRRLCVNVAQPDAGSAVPPPRFGKIIKKLEKERQQSEVREDAEQPRRNGDGNRKRQQSDPSEEKQQSRQKERQQSRQKGELSTGTKLAIHHMCIPVSDVSVQECLKPRELCNLPRLAPSGVAWSLQHSGQS